MKKQIEIIPAILTDDIEDFKEKISLVEKMGSWLQIDVGDGEFIENSTLNLKDLKGEIPKNLNVELHLMVLEPEKYFLDCHYLRAKRVIFHFESTLSPEAVLYEMQRFNFQKGIALDPETPPASISSFVRFLDCVLLLSVVPGAQGREFQDVLWKIEVLRKLKKDLVIGIDGGIKLENLDYVLKFQPDYIVVGSGIFGEEDPIEAYKLFLSKIE